MEENKSQAIHGDAGDLAEVLTHHGVRYMNEIDQGNEACLLRLGTSAGGEKTASGQLKLAREGHVRSNHLSSSPSHPS